MKASQTRGFFIKYSQKERALASPLTVPYVEPPRTTKIVELKIFVLQIWANLENAQTFSHFFYGIIGISIAKSSVCWVASIETLLVSHTPIPSRWFNCSPFILTEPFITKK